MFVSVDLNTGDWVSAYTNVSLQLTDVLTNLQVELVNTSRNDSDGDDDVTDGVVYTRVWREKAVPMCGPGLVISTTTITCGKWKQITLL